jgi:hypothetical protein
MSARNIALKLAILERYPSQRAFLWDLKHGKPPLQIEESRLSKIVCGQAVVRPEEARAISWRLQKSIKQLFGNNS